MPQTPSDDSLLKTIALFEERDHSTSVEDWAVLLSLANPKEYPEDKLQDERASLSISQAARVAVLRRRCRAGQSLWHPDDVIEGMEDVRVGPVLKNGRNGEPYQEGIA